MASFTGMLQLSLVCEECGARPVFRECDESFRDRMKQLFISGVRYGNFGEQRFHEIANLDIIIKGAKFSWIFANRPFMASVPTPPYTMHTVSV